MAKSFEDLMKKTCSKEVIISGYKKAMNYWADYIGMSEKQVDSENTVVTTAKNKPKRRDPSRRW